MKISQLSGHEKLRPTKIPLRDVPHITLEPTMACNLTCSTCYNLAHDYAKSLPELEAELDIALKKRNLETVSILGGEPTLHPRLIELVSYIKSKGLVCQLLTNGIVFNSAKGEALLERLVAAGLDRMIVHIDAGQGRSSDENTRLCNSLFSRFEAKRLTFALSVTVTDAVRDDIAELMKEFARYRYFDGILVTQAKNMDQLTAPAVHPGPDLSEISSGIERGLSIRASSYVPSSQDDREVCWLTYFYYYNTNTQKTFYLSSGYSRLFRSLYRNIEGKEFFARTMNPRYSKISFIMTALVELLMSPARIPSLARLVSHSGLMSSIRFHYIVIQSAPSFNGETGKPQICYHCPDATIRNGKITPVCVADRINPLGPEGIGHQINSVLRDAVYGHLEEP